MKENENQTDFFFFFFNGGVAGNALLVEGQLGGWDESASGFGSLKRCGRLVMLSAALLTSLFNGNLF